VQMQYRRLGRTGLHVSAVGFGTCQLRMVPERQAVETLVRGFELGVNVVHTAPDYEGAEALVARAIRESGREIIVLSQAYDIQYKSHGHVDHFERLFESTCETLGSERLELFGIACIDDREAYQENVWGGGGMIEFLQRKKAEGRLGGIYTTTHGGPEYVRRLIESDVFDALMVAYNPLGFHLLSFSPPPGRSFEDMAQTEAALLPLAQERDVGIIVMKALAGGLLCTSRAFPPRTPLGSKELRAADVLRTVLADARIACVMPGTASVDEAEENARAGHVVLGSTFAVVPDVGLAAAGVRAELCSRCGQCDTSCSQDLSISWLFRAAYVNLQPSETYETWDEVEYFRLHPGSTPICSTCPDVTCACPFGIDIPGSLQQLHGQVMELAERQLVRGPQQDEEVVGDAMFGAKVILRDIPARPGADGIAGGRIYVENAGERGWFVDDRQFKYARVALGVYVDGCEVQRVALRHDTHRGGRAHFVFAFHAPADEHTHTLALVLLGEHAAFAAGAGLPLVEALLQGGGPIAEPLAL
jgi:predicted aldo/keto reductase-like oxidoreductase